MTSPAMPHGSSAIPTRPSANNLRSWLAAVLIPEVLVGALFLGEGLTAALGYSEESRGPILLEWLISLAVLAAPAIPAVIAVVFGLRARREGHTWAVIPVAAGVIALAYLLMSLVLMVLGQIIS